MEPIAYCCPPLDTIPSASGSGHLPPDRSFPGAGFSRQRPLAFRKAEGRLDRCRLFDAVNKENVGLIRCLHHEAKTISNNILKLLAKNPAILVRIKVSELQ